MGTFVIEHTARNRSGRFMHFNGTAGVWRRTTIDDGGGCSMTRSPRLGPELSAVSSRLAVRLPPAVLRSRPSFPPEMIAFKQQAHRWTKGSMQTGIKLLPRILRSHLPQQREVGGLLPPDQHDRLPADGPGDNPDVPDVLRDAQSRSSRTRGASTSSACRSSFLATCSASTFFCFSQRELFGKQAGVEGDRLHAGADGPGHRHGHQQRQRRV
jgi:hypothetical protein